MDEVIGFMGNNVKILKPGGGVEDRKVIVDEGGILKALTKDEYQYRLTREEQNAAEGSKPQE